MYSKAIQLYMCTPVFRLFSVIVCYKVWDLAPCATEEVLVYFTGSSVAASPGLLAYPSAYPSAFPFGDRSSCSASVNLFSFFK